MTEPCDANRGDGDAPWEGWPPARNAGRSDSGVTGFARGRVRSIGHAVAGLAFALRSQTNMRLHAVVAATTLAAGFVFRIGADEWRWLIVAIALVIAGEALNTGIEQACDAVGGRSEPIRHAKDAAAGGVLVLAVAALLIGLGIFIPHVAAAWRGGVS